MSLCDFIPTGETRGDMLVLRCRYDCGKPVQYAYPGQRIIRQCALYYDMPLVSSPGPGTILSKALRSAGFTETGVCGCWSHAAQMNAWGPDRCHEHLEEIVGWLMEAASQNGLEIVESAVRDLILAAIEQSERLA